MERNKISKRKRRPPTSSTSMRTRRVAWIALAALAIGGLFVGAETLGAQQEPDNCMNDIWNEAASKNKGSLVCTAKEVFIEEDVDGNKIIDAMVVNGDGCDFPGDTATVAIVADLHFNADRFDIGIYSA